MREIKEDWVMLFNRIDEIPLVLPEIKVKGIKIGGWVFELVTYAIDDKEPYFKARYVNPNDRYQYIFNSTYSEELFEYLEEFDLLENLYNCGNPKMDESDFCEECL